MSWKESRKFSLATFTIKSQINAFNVFGETWMI